MGNTILSRIRCKLLLLPTLAGHGVHVLLLLRTCVRRNLVFMRHADRNKDACQIWNELLLIRRKMCATGVHRPEGRNLLLLACPPRLRSSYPPPVPPATRIPAAPHRHFGRNLVFCVLPHAGARGKRGPRGPSQHPSTTGVFPSPGQGIQFSSPSHIPPAQISCCFGRNLVFLAHCSVGEVNRFLPSRAGISTCSASMALFCGRGARQEHSKLHGEPTLSNYGPT